MRDLTRREFLDMSASLVVMLHVHGVGSPSPPATKAPMPLIRHLRLKTGALPAMREFYRDRIGLKLAADSSSSATFQAGQSLITFEQVSDGSMPWYHFAFNIPQNKLMAAHKWQTERTPLLPIPERLRDPRYPIDVVDYSHWNAHSIFFYDPGGNVVEYIARHDLHNDSDGPFSVKDILCASEIGLIVDDVLATATQLEKVAGLQDYRGRSDAFTALGDEQGLLLVMKRGRILNFQSPSQEKAAKIYPTEAEINGEKATAHQISGFPYQVRIHS